MEQQKPEQWVYIDGEFYPRADAKISVFDHGLLYGDGVFEGIRAYEGRIFRLEQHLTRLYDSARYLHLTIPISREEMAEACRESCRRNGLRDAYLRLVVTRGKGDLGLSPYNCPRASVICIADRIRLYPAEHYRDGLTLMTASTRRTNAETLNPRIKSLNYLNNILARIEGMLAGGQEALMINQEGFVVEATSDNIFLVREGGLVTPPIWIGALRGITRDATIEIARREGIAVREEPFTRYDIFAASECFLTGTAAEIIPVKKLDGRPIGDGRPGPLTRRLSELYRDLVNSEGDPV